MVYDVTDRGSFNNVKNWMAQIQQYADFDVNKILLANKCDADSPDSPAKRVVSTEEGKKLAEEFNVNFFETSAMNNTNVVPAFETVAKQVVKRLSAENDIQVNKSTSGNKAQSKVDLNADSAKSKYANCGCS